MKRAGAMLSAAVLAALLAGCRRDWDRFGRGRWPSRETTGVPADAVLATRTGTLRASEASNATADGYDCVIENVELRGNILVDCPRTLIRRVRVTLDGYRAIENTQAQPFVVEDSEVECGGVEGQYGISGSNVTATRVYVHGCGLGVAIEGAASVRDSFVAARAPVVRRESGAGAASVVHNTLDARPEVSGVSSLGNGAVFILDAAAGELVLERNLLAGGLFTLDIAAAVSLRVVGNRFVRDTWVNGPRSIGGSVTVTEWVDNREVTEAAGRWVDGDAIQ